MVVESLGIETTDSAKQSLGIFFVYSFTNYYFFDNKKFIVFKMFGKTKIRPISPLKIHNF